ncbi:alpha/beta hydrolase [Actinoplanes sp. NBRC 103695]|uniref:alpha/beta hydrolase n=1 Tax=Actinoplanes sp. NBRC 103695 TaxID=3032202 RepID=UPI0024A1BEB6|nr:alpha/beta hydrolase [Actinoplanes sp. NBRC 103695]GLY94016.1 hypothetical protein Acsp02_12720 [Actinoplanes sp. NBRC 103695]
MIDATTPGRFRKLLGAFLAAAAVLVAVPFFFAALLVTAGATGNAILSYAAAALIASLIATVGARRGSIRAGVRAGLSLAMAAGLSWAWFGAPITGTAMPGSAAVRYWDLPTGSRIAYVRMADKVTHPEPVIMVHGGPGAPSSGNDEFAPHLVAAGFAVYDYQQVGSGRSSRLETSEYTVARHVADLEAIRQKLAVPAMVLVGSSWGGQLTAEYLAAHPGKVAKAIVASPGAMSGDSFGDGSPAPGGQDQSRQPAAHRRFAATFFLGQVGGLRAAATLMSDRTADALYQQFVGSLNMSSGCGAAAEVHARPAGYGLWANIATLRSAAKTADPRPKLRHDETPLLVLRAQCDYLDWEVTRDYRDTFPRAVMQTIDGAGHTVLADRPDETGAAAVAFLTGKALPDKPYLAAEEPWS